MKNSKPRVIDLFAGVGGMSLGFSMAGCDIIFANEYDRIIAESYKKNHPLTEMLIADITKVNQTDTFTKFIDNVDIVIGGPPCQGFSQKGKRKTINDDRNFLFKHFYSVVKMVNPSYFIMENVPNLLTAENGYFKKEIEMLFSEIGYNVFARILNAADYGVPQNRKRAFIVGAKSRQPFNFPNKFSKNTTIWEAISDLAFLNSGEGLEEQKYMLPIQSDYQKMLRNGQETLFNHISTKHSRIALERLKMIPINGGRKDLPQEHLTKSIYSGTWTRMVKDEISVTITTRFDTPASGKFTHPILDRAITVREAARIQSFPDSFRFYGIKTSQMHQVGNAVPPLLAKAVAGAILKHDENSN